MISMSAWKPALVIPAPRPSRGPAIHPGQPPLLPGTYCEGSLATPAVSRKTVVTTPSRPSHASARTARDPRRTPPAASRSAVGPAALSRCVVGVAASIGPLLRLGGLQVFDLPGKLC